MRKFRTYDVLAMIIDEQTKKLGSDFRELDFNKKSLENECEMIDMFMDETEAIGFEAEVEDDTLHIIISVITPYVEYVGTANAFMEIASKTLEICIESYDNDNMKLSFVYDGIWDKYAA